MDTQEISPREAAVKLGVRLDGIYSLLWAGRLRGRKSNGRWLVDAADVRKRIRARQQRERTSADNAAV
jgi:hypothetical protein